MRVVHEVVAAAFPRSVFGKDLDLNVGGFAALLATAFEKLGDIINILSITVGEGRQKTPATSVPVAGRAPTPRGRRGGPSSALSSGCQLQASSGSIVGTSRVRARARVDSDGSIASIASAGMNNFPSHRWR